MWFVWNMSIWGVFLYMTIVHGWSYFILLIPTLLTIIPRGNDEKLDTNE